MAGVGAGSVGPEGGSSPLASRESTTPAQAPGSGNRDMREGSQGFIKRRDKVELRDQSFNVQTEGGVKVPGLIPEVGNLPVIDPPVERDQPAQGASQDRPGAGGWVTNEEELNQRVQELAARTKAAEQTKQQLAGEAVGVTGHGEGVLNESMTGAWRDRGDVAPDTQGVLNEPMREAFKGGRPRSERLTYNDWRPNVEANLEDLALKAYLKGVHKVVHGELGINDSAELPEGAQDIYRAFTQAVIKARTPATEGESAPDTNAGNAPATGSSGPTPAK